MPPSTWIALESPALEWGIQAARIVLVVSYVVFASVTEDWGAARPVTQIMGAVMLAYTAAFIVLLRAGRTRVVTVAGCVLDPLVTSAAVLVSAAVLDNVTETPFVMVGPGTAVPVLPGVGATLLRLRPLPAAVFVVLINGGTGAGTALLSYETPTAALVLSRVLGMTSVGLSLVAVFWPIQRMREQLQAAAEEKLQLVSTVAHELRGPLTGVRAHLDLLQDGAAGDVPERQGELVRGAARSAARMEQMIAAFAQVEWAESSDIALKPGPVDLGAAAADVKETMAPMAGERGIAIELTGFDDLPHAWADRPSIEQILSNLLANAVRFSFDGGSVTMRGYARPGSVRVSVEDRGMGIPEEDQRHIFDRFYRGADPRKHRIRGTGLGLYVSRTLVERNGGRMWFTSMADAGSIFSFSLPLADSRRLSRGGGPTSISGDGLLNGGREAADGDIH